jgi:hypothetical protein
MRLFDFYETYFPSLKIFFDYFFSSLDFGDEFFSLNWLKILAWRWFLNFGMKLMFFSWWYCYRFILFRKYVFFLIIQLRNLWYYLEFNRLSMIFIFFYSIDYWSLNSLDYFVEFWVIYLGLFERLICLLNSWFHLTWVNFETIFFIAFTCFSFVNYCGFVGNFPGFAEFYYFLLVLWVSNSSVKNSFWFWF